MNRAEFLISVGKRIAKARKSAGKSQAELAELTDLSVSCISKIERGINNFSAESLSKIAIALAPGTTKGEIKFSITGKPEVATKVTVSLGATKDVFLKYDSDNDGTKDATYYPVVFTLKHTYATGANPIAPAVEGTGATVTTNGNTETVTGTLEEINKVLANLQTAMTQVAPNYVYNDTFVLSWAWDFEAGNDNLDTILGDIAANVYANGYAKNDGNYCLDTSYSFTIRVDQVD